MANNELDYLKGIYVDKELPISCYVLLPGTCLVNKYRYIAHYKKRIPIYIRYFKFLYVTKICMHYDELSSFLNLQPCFNLA